MANQCISVMISLVKKIKHGVCRQDYSVQLATEGCVECVGAAKESDGSV